jgi:hypothetical protein
LPTHLTPRGARQRGVFVRRGPAATVVSRTAAQQKRSQGDAKYQTAPKGDQRCEGCANFQAPNACKFVQGDISPSGWCQLFVKKT